MLSGGERSRLQPPSWTPPPAANRHYTRTAKCLTSPETLHFWRQAIRDQAGSGMGIRAWCHRHRVKEAAFHWWRRELPRRDAEKETASFVPVHVSGDRPRDGDPQLPLLQLNRGGERFEDKVSI